MVGFEEVLEEGDKAVPDSEVGLEAYRHDDVKD